MLVVVNDTQLYKNCDEEALGACLSFIKHYRNKITHFVFNGDISDYEAQSRFSKILGESINEVRKEIDATKWLIRYISELLPNAEKVFVNGNHDKPRWENMIKDQSLGIEAWIKTPEEMFELKKLKYRVIDYGKGQFYRWHDRIFWHGHRAGKKSDIAKLELQDAGMSVTTAHINKNMFHEERNALGKLMSGIVHGGFSKDNLSFVKSANSNWSQGFGVYYWSKEVGEQVYSITMQHKNPRFIWEGKVFDGKGFRLPV